MNKQPAAAVMVVYVEKAVAGKNWYTEVTSAKPGWLYYYRQISN